MADPADSRPPLEPALRPVGVRARLTGLSDHVFGFAATLMAARLVLPADASETSPLDALTDRGTTLVIYAIAFLLMGYQWWRHHQVFLRIERTSKALLWLNLAMLACIALMPYPTQVLGEAWVPLAGAMFLVPLAASSLLLIVIWEHSLRLGLAPVATDPAHLRHLRANLWLLPAVAAVSGALVLVDGAAAATAWVLLPVGVVVISRRFPDPDAGTTPSMADRLRSSVGGYVDDGLERVVAYSDGIYAVVLTIIAERLGGEELTAGADLRQDELWEQVRSQQNLLWALGLTFFTVGLQWTLHADLFGRIVRLRTPLLWLALIHLMVVALQPFGLSIFTDFGFADSTQATVIYLSFMLAASATISAMGLYGVWAGRCVDERITMAERRSYAWQGFAAYGIFATAIVIALVTDDQNSGWAFTAFLLFPLTDRLIDRAIPIPDRSTDGADATPST